MLTFFSVDPYSWAGIGAAIICGCLIGSERQLRGKPAGMRTSSLIVLGTYLFTATAAAVGSDMTDPARIVGQVVTGVGFLGAGVMLAREGIIVGVTSAATIWALAAIGVGIALIDELTAIKISIIVLFILVGIDFIEELSGKFSQGVHKKSLPDKQGEK